MSSSTFPVVVVTLCILIAVVDNVVDVDGDNGAARCIISGGVQYSEIEHFACAN